MIYEKNLRNWFKKIWAQKVAWIEPGLGSSAGLPDVMTSVLVKGNVCLAPIELKVANFSLLSINKVPFSECSLSIKLYFRPTQIRYHRMAYRESMPTFVLAALGSIHDASIWLWPGWQAVDQKGKLRLDMAPWCDGFVLRTRLDRYSVEHGDVLREVLIKQWERWYGGLDSSQGARWP